MMRSFLMGFVHGTTNAATIVLLLWFLDANVVINFN